MLAKAATLPADEVFFDLEDSVVPDQKEEARANVIAALRASDLGDRQLGVRVNPPSTEWFESDVLEVAAAAEGRLDFVMLPKAERATDVRMTAHLLGRAEDQAGLDREIGIEIQIETASGLARVEEIAEASSRAQTLVFGPADMSASLGMPALTAGLPQPGYPGDHWHHVLMRILVAARVAGLQAIDGPYLVVADLEGLRESALRSRALGYDGKWAVHPSQVDVLNEVYSPSREEYEKAAAMIGAHERAGREGKGASMFGAEMIDEASRKMAEVIVARGRAAGLARGSSDREDGSGSDDA